MQASEALLHLHGLGCVHRDFKPANILLQADLHAMLSDTGFAKSADSRTGAGGAADGTKAASMTSRGAVHTTGYCDPLIFSAGEFSPRTDAYAVGVTLLVCLTDRGAEGIFDACEAEHDADFEYVSSGFQLASYRRASSLPIMKADGGSHARISRSNLALTGRSMPWRLHS